MRYWICDGLVLLTFKKTKHTLTGRKRAHAYKLSALFDGFRESNFEFGYANDVSRMRYEMQLKWARYVGWRWMWVLICIGDYGSVILFHTKIHPIYHEMQMKNRFRVLPRQRQQLLLHFPLNYTEPGVWCGSNRFGDVGDFSHSLSPCFSIYITRDLFLRRRPDCRCIRLWFWFFLFAPFLVYLFWVFFYFIIVENQQSKVLITDSKSVQRSKRMRLRARCIDCKMRAREKVLSVLQKRQSSAKWREDV